MFTKEGLSRLGDIKYNCPLASFTTFRIGGTAERLIIPYSQEALPEIFFYLKKKELPYFILGGGSNILITSDTLQATVVKLELNEFYRLDSENRLYVGSSVPLRSILRFCLEESLSGLEFLAGVPATLGGALANNCSFKGKNIFSVIKRVKVMNPDNGQISYINTQDIDYGYRFSSLKGLVILGAEICFLDDSRQSIKQSLREALSYRINVQELGKYCAGCIFKNTEGSLSAGMLIDQAQLKGLRRGQAYVSYKHANFIINEKDATSSDVIFLVEHIKEKVYNKFGILLKEEIERWQC